MLVQVPQQISDGERLYLVIARHAHNGRGCHIQGNPDLGLLLKLHASLVEPIASLTQASAEYPLHREYEKVFIHTSEP